MGSRRILLLGGSGFVGRNLLESISGDESLQIDVPSHERLDVLDESAVVAVLSKGNYDVILNCLDFHAPNPDAAFAEQRLRQFHNLAHHADLFGKMIYFGSGAEYGRQIPVARVDEDDFGRVIPSDSYGFALYQMSEFACASKNIYNFRLFGIFGKYELWNRRFISNCICRALASRPLSIRQNRIMDYLHIDDLARMVSWALRKDPACHAYNATSGRGYSLLDLANDVLSITGRVDLPIRIASDELADEYTSSNGRIAREMGGFVAEPMAQSIEKMVGYYSGVIETIDITRL